MAANSFESMVTNVDDFNRNTFQPKRESTPTTPPHDELTPMALDHRINDSKNSSNQLPSPASSPSPALVQRSLPAAEPVNWVGKLTEYRSKNPSEGGLQWHEECHDGRFICTVTLAESRQPLGDPYEPHTRKKSAKHAAAKHAIRWLLEHNYMAPGELPQNAFGPTETAPGPRDSPARELLGGGAPLHPASGNSSYNFSSTPRQLASYSSSSRNGNGGESCAKRVVDLCLSMGINLPQYRLEQDREFPAFWTGHAQFNDPNIPQSQVGFVERVYGRKRAHEQCAAAVVEFLQDIRDEKERKMRERQELMMKRKGERDEGADDRAGRIKIEN